MDELPSTSVTALGGGPHEEPHKELGERAQSRSGLLFPVQSRVLCPLTPRMPQQKPSSAPGGPC